MMTKTVLLSSFLIAAASFLSPKAQEGGGDTKADHVWTGVNTFSNKLVAGARFDTFGTNTFWGPTETIQGLHVQGGLMAGFDASIGEDTLWFRDNPLAPYGHISGLISVPRAAGLPLSILAGSNMDNIITQTGPQPAMPVSIANGIVYADAVVLDGGVLQNSHVGPLPLLIPGQLYYWSSNGVAMVTTCGRLGTLKTTAIAGTAE